MSKKLCILITTLIGALVTGANAIVGYVDPAYAPAIISAIGLVGTAVCSALEGFIKTDLTKGK